MPSARLGAVGNITGELVEARQYLEESVAIGREMQDEHSLRTSLVNLGNVFYLQADYEQAKIYYEEVLPLCQKAEDRSAEAITLCNLSSIAYQAKAYDEAERLMLAGAKTFLEINSLQFYLQAQATLASIHTAMGEYEQARAELQWALNKALTEPIPHIVPQVLYETGCLYLALGRTTEAMVLLYWVLANEMSLAEHRQEAQKRLAEVEADLPAGQITTLKEQAKTVEAQDGFGATDAG
ncbi:MAG: tetratricopeptide repeat protein [Candidatus Promineifilaceae bacterium]